mmetsp:Transcript_14856/g.58239  ORF Transcript_14856/g.58239 Transcript_14856/m.58239 type:complete len:206 (+) Transcript_14856:376-993(+)
MINGVLDISSEYLAVDISRMLSAPWSPANGWDASNLASSTLPVPFSASTLPTKRSTLPSAAAAAACSAMTPSNSGSLRSYSATSQSSNSAGTRDWTSTSSRARSTPLSRAAMTTFRATSRPLRSSRGSGSVYPALFAASTTSLNGWPAPGFHVLNRKLIVPEKMPCTDRTRSPEARSVRSVDTTGSPAPMVPSYNQTDSPSSAAA